MLRKTWLEENGAKESDVISDDNGEYILVEPTLMDDGDEPEDGRMKKVYLPDDLEDEQV